MKKYTAAVKILSSGGNLTVQILIIYCIITNYIYNLTIYGDSFEKTDFFF